MKLWLQVGGMFVVLCFIVLCGVLFIAGCDNKAGMAPGSAMLVTDKDGNQYIVYGGEG